MFGMGWLLRMSRWSRRPPGMGRVLLVLAVVAVCLALAGLQWAGFWPDWARVNGRPRLH